MILTVTLNAAVDKTLVVPGFKACQMNRPTQALATAGGKGLNVTRVLAALSEPALATGLVAGITGRTVLDLLDAEGVVHDFVRLPVGESRMCLAIVHPEHLPHTEIHERGHTVTSADWGRFVTHFEHLLPRASWVALSGSLPPGLGPEAYLQLIDLARQAGKPVSLDTSGPELRDVLLGAPDVAKPNQEEAERALGWPVTLENLPAAVASLRDFGPKIVALSMGAAGAAVAGENEAWWVPAPEVTVVNPIGSGDSFLAALLTRMRRGDCLADAARWAVAAGSANATVAGAACCTLADIEPLVPRTHAYPLSEASLLAQH